MNKIIDEVINFIKKNHFNSHLINWIIVKEKVKNIETIQDFRIFLDKYILPKLKDNFHSRYQLEGIRSKDHKTTNTLEKTKNPMPYKKIIDNNILFLYIPTTPWYENHELVKKYYNKINESLQDYKKYNGIVIDLSECNGGDYFNIVAPFYQIFGKTIIAHGFNKNNKKNCFTHVLIKDDIIEKKFNPNKITDNKESPIKIAVIVSSYTRSAGEFATLFFQNRENVKIIGEKTGGMTTWQNVHQLNTINNSNLNIGLAFAIDRNNKHYDKKYYIKPHIMTDEPLKESIKYILKN